MPAITITILAFLSIVAGILILIWPKIVRIALGIYLILMGIIQLIDLNIAIF